MAVMTSKQFVEKCIDVAKNYKTLYVMGCIGAPMTESNKTTYINHHSYNRQADRTAMIKAATADTFGFDCVCLIKAILWGWNGDKSKSHGGTVYASNGVPDVNANGMIALCKNVTTNFSNIEVGEAVWCEGHIGVYIGDGLAVECTPIWKNNVQITAVANIGSKSGYNARRWTKHGKLPYISYTKESASNTVKKSVDEVAKEVVQGLWGNGAERKQKLTEAGYNYSDIQSAVNKLASVNNVDYFQKTSYNGVSFVEGLRTINATVTFAYRKKVASANGITNYTGTAAQNTELLNKLKQGKLIKP